MRNPVVNSPNGKNLWIILWCTTLKSKLSVFTSLILIQKNREYLSGFFVCFVLLLKFLFFWCGPFKKFLLNLLQYCFYLMFCLLGPKTCEIIAPQPGINPHPLHWKVKSQPLGSPCMRFTDQKAALSKRVQGPPAVTAVWLQSPWGTPVCQGFWKRCSPAFPNSDVRTVTETFTTS